ncbi:hypothetical protein ACKWTF_004387 [Chironomus riparius]
MYSSVCDDDILEINADINDILSEDETACIEVINSEVIPLDKASQDDLKLAPKEFVWLKFFRKGNLSCSNLRMEILRYLATEIKLKMNGFFFRDDVNVLVEVEVDSAFKRYLATIYEERLGNKVLKKKSIHNIINICDGKFSVIINNHVICLTLLTNSDVILLPCKSLTVPFGLSSGEVLNVVSAGFIVDNRFSVHETFLLIHEELKHNMNFFIGMRLVTCTENSEESCIRFSVRHPYLNTEVLSKLKKIFSVVHFSFTTMHLLPVHKAEYIESVCYSLRINDDLKIITNDDAIYPKKPIQN